MTGFLAALFFVLPTGETGTDFYRDYVFKTETGCVLSLRDVVKETSEEYTVTGAGCVQVEFRMGESGWYAVVVADQ